MLLKQEEENEDGRGVGLSYLSNVKRPTAHSQSGCQSIGRSVGRSVGSSPVAATGNVRWSRSEYDGNGEGLSVLAREVQPR
jgi:hypothetical protein